MEEYVGPYPVQMRALTLLGLFAGMRLVDAVLLKYESIDQVNHIITYIPQKTRRTSRAVVTVPILPVLRESLALLPKEDDGGYVLPEIAGHYRRNKDFIVRKVNDLIHIATGNAKQAFDGQCLRERRLYGFHSLRHTFTTEAAKAGATPGQLKAMTGDTLQTIDKFYAKTQGLATAKAPEFMPIVRMLSHGTHSGDADRAADID